MSLLPGSTPPLPSRRRFLCSAGGAAAWLGLQGSRSLASLSRFTGAEEALLARAKELSTDEPLRLLVPGGCEANLQPIIRRFEQATGGRVSLEPVAVDDVATHILLRSGPDASPFDVALPPTFSLPDLVEADCLAPLDALADRYEPDGFRDRMLYALGDSYGGALYGYQTDGDVYVMFYRKSWLQDPKAQDAYEERFGEPLEIALTFEQLDRQLEFFHRPEEGRYGGALFRNADYIGWEWWLRLHGKGRLPFDSEGNPQIDSAEGVAALEDLMAASKFLSPGSKTNGLMDNWGEYSRGETFANIGWGGTQKALCRADSAVREDLVFGPTPGGLFGGKPTPISHFNWGWNYVVSKRSPRVELGYLFSLLAVQPEASTLAVAEGEGFFDPFRAEHYGDPAVRRVYSDAFLEQHRESLKQGIPDLYLRSRSEYFGALNRFLLRAERGEIAPDQALGIIQREWSKIRERVGGDSQARQWGELLDKYPEALRKHLS